MQYDFPRGCGLSVREQSGTEEISHFRYRLKRTAEILCEEAIKVYNYLKVIRCLSNTFKLII